MVFIIPYFSLIVYSDLQNLLESLLRDRNVSQKTFPKKANEYKLEVYCITY